MYTFFNNYKLQVKKCGKHIRTYFPAHKTHRSIIRTVIFSLKILEKKMMNVF